MRTFGISPHPRRRADLLRHPRDLRRHPHRRRRPARRLPDSKEKVMTEHLDINLVAWPHNRAARRALAKQLGFTGVAAERAYKAQKEALKPKRGRPRKVAQDDLPTADFVGDRPPPVSVVVKDASERKAPQVQVLIDGKPAEFVTQWAASVEDLEHAYMQNVREGGKPVYVHAQNMGGLTFHEDLSAKGPDGAPVRVGTLLKPAEVATLRDEVSHTL